MYRVRFGKAVTILPNISLVLMTSTGDARTGPQAESPSPSREEYASLAPEEVDGLVAPIVLYPDALVAQILNRKETLLQAVQLGDGRPALIEDPPQAISGSSPL